MKRLALLAGMFTLLVATVSVAHAQMVPPGLANLFSSAPSFEDQLFSNEQQQFNQLNITSKFGIGLHHTGPVCSGLPSGDEVQCDARVVTDASGNPLASASAPAGYSPAQFLGAYNLSGKAAGRPIIAIVDAYDDPNITSDLTTYDTKFGLPQLPTCTKAIASATSPCFEKVSQTGSTTKLPSSNSGWDLEISLDIEMAHGMCQNCGVLLVEGNSATFANLMAAENEAVALGGNVVSNSWGAAEFSGETSYDSYFNHPGVAFTVAAGDGGYGVEYPAASPNVTAVGGTMLLLNSNGSYNQEVAWSGTGSGCSAYESKPSWQKDAKCTKRTDNDVSADADPNTGAAIYDSVQYDGAKGWFEVGGTSLASPLVASTYALSGNIPSATKENSLPYASSPANLHDVISGSNGSCGGSYLCTAVAGYDGPTGLGTPAGSGAF